VPWLDRHTSFGCRVAHPPNDEHDLLQERRIRPLEKGTVAMPDSRLWQPRFSHLPRPWTGVLVGGSSLGETAKVGTRAFREVAELSLQLGQLPPAVAGRQHPGGTLVTLLGVPDERHAGDTYAFGRDRSGQLLLIRVALRHDSHRKRQVGRPGPSDRY
jgi:hypothetical protein